MSDTGWEFPGTVATSSFPQTVDWTNPDNVKLDNAAYATSQEGNSGGTYYLDCTNFDFSSILVKSTIDGIEVRMGDYSYDTTPAYTWNYVHLRLADGTSYSTDNNDADLTAPTTSLQTSEAGGSTDLWGETITRAEVQDIDWGVRLKLGTVGNGTRNMSLDYVQMRVFYTEPLNTGWVYPGTGVSEDAGNHAWVNPSNVTTDANTATCDTVQVFDTTEMLAAHNYDFSVIPIGATIDGVQVELHDYHVASGETGIIGDCFIRMDDATYSTIDHNADLSAPSTSPQTSYAGGSTDLWGETLTRAIVQDSDFGWGVRMLSAHITGANFDVDAMRMKVFYTLAAASETAEVTLVDRSGTPLAGLTGLKWAWFDQDDPSLLVAPTDKGSGETTDSAGLFSADLSGTALTVGGTGSLLIRDLNGYVYGLYKVTL